MVCERRQKCEIFHKITKIRNATKVIHSLKIGGVCHQKQEQISEYVVKHFRDLFNNFSVL